MRTLVALSTRRLALLGDVRSIGALGRALIRARLAGIGGLRLGAGGGSFPRRGGILSCSGGIGRGLVRRSPALSRRTLRAVGCSAAGTTGAMVFRGRRTFSSIGGCGSFRPLVPRSRSRLRRRKRCGCGAFRLYIGLGLPAAAMRAKRRVDGRGCRHGSVICSGGRRCICSSLFCVTSNLLGPLRGTARLGRSLRGLARLRGIARKRRLTRGSRSSIGRIRRLLGAARPRGLSGGRQRFLRASGGAALLANDRRLRDLRQGARLRDLGRHLTGRRLRCARRVRLARSGCRRLLGGRLGLLCLLRRTTGTGGAARLLLRLGSSCAGAGGGVRILCHYACSTFFQSSKNDARPRSVSGCLTAFFNAANGTVAISQPMRAAWVMWFGVRIEAPMISTSWPKS